MACALGLCLGLAGRAWRNLASFYADWRCKLIALSGDNLSVESRKATAIEFCHLEPCCLDDHFTRKIRGLVGDSPDALMGHSALLRSLKLWGDTGLLSNMGTE
eukprot:4014070-Pyramimonas_sp.AAC.1